MRAFLTLLILIAKITSIYSQSNKFNLLGQVVDSSNIPLAFASIYLLESKDSSLLDYTRAEENGSFALKNIPSNNYLLKINYVGYLPLQIKIDLSGSSVNLGKIILKPISKELFEVVIKAAKAPMSIRGDTIEYDASTFKVPAGSTLEDLLRKLPGIEVNQDGSIKSEGRDVTRMTVEGKQFFGGDPKAATKNLPAEGISKVQVFNDVSEEEKLTGIKGNSQDKNMNITLKDDFKKGGFGKITGGIGTEDRAELKGNYNKFNQKEQFSILASGTNTGRNGLSWNDYQDFKGSNSFNWNDDGDFGFSNGGMVRYYFSDEDEDNIETNFFGSSANGFPKKISGGLNYNYDNKKTKFSGTYFYNFDELFSEAIRSQNFLYPDNPYNTFDTAFRTNTKQSHKADLRIEQEFDSLHSIVFKSSISVGGVQNELSGFYTTLLPSDILLSDLSMLTEYDNNILNWQNSIIFRKKFKKKGRSLGVSAAYLLTASDRDSKQNSINNFYNIGLFIDSIAQLNQVLRTENNKSQIKSSIQYVEPIGKRFYIQSFYNYSDRNTDYQRNVFDQFQDSSSINQFLSRTFDNNIDYHRVGTSLRYSYKGTNISLGVAYQDIILKGNFKTGFDTSSTLSTKVSYQTLIPNLSFQIDLKKNRNINFEYSVNLREPSVNDLLPVVDNTNPLFIRLGNPALLPELSHRISGGFRKFDPLNFTNLWLGINYTYNENAFVYSRDIDLKRITRIIPTNITGTQSLWANIDFGFPVIKNKFTLNTGYNLNYNKGFTLINTLKDEITTLGHGFNFRLNLTPVDKFSFFLNGNARFSEQYSELNTSESTKLQNYSSGIELNYKFPYKIFLNSSFNYSQFINKSNSFNESVPLLNISVYKVFLKGDKGEIRLSGYDLFNENLGINQSAWSNVVTQTTTFTLARYFLLSFTYNMRGIKTSLEKNRRGFSMG